MVSRSEENRFDIQRIGPAIDIAAEETCRHVYGTKLQLTPGLLSAPMFGPLRHRQGYGSLSSGYRASAPLWDRRAAATCTSSRASPATDTSLSSRASATASRGPRTRRRHSYGRRTCSGTRRGPYWPSWATSIGDGSASCTATATSITSRCSTS
ncbi:hypothetical protein HPB51_022936 [Rhipicephalus microplus]|uniref:Uncharacterized protein n=1 Tax=Rhipicephalus microplus TaxID=6941 RepID=A0A9J6DQP0_RHIMP|nr:hypothetical protein HPB51_022936 [Rhipicephalus microplus]